MRKIAITITIVVAVLVTVFSGYVIYEPAIHDYIEAYKVDKQRRAEYERMHVGVEKIALLPALKIHGDEWFSKCLIISHSGGGKWLRIYKFS